MPLNCTVLPCKSNQERDGWYTSFFTFPKNPEIGPKWLENVRQSGRPDDWIPSRNARVCSRHFLDQCFKPISNKGRRRLKSTAIPTKDMGVPEWEVKHTFEEEEGEEEELKRHPTGVIVDPEVVHPTDPVLHFNLDEANDPDLPPTPPIPGLSHSELDPLFIPVKGRKRKKKKTVTLEENLEEDEPDPDDVESASPKVTHDHPYTELLCSKSKETLAKENIELRKSIIDLQRQKNVLKCKLLKLEAKYKKKS